ncbi:LuxR C-terminal-related transcriptional regulator [Streptomyces sp. NBC_01092]|uniref:helix-turn-helix transcriptional regulator n=1 Tax=Streptomyces sp. NBC_01092 TaxID=2903748 RepID=UPI0038647C34|nr:response regulator transcription factor [Streptomyces sp. NBC_01092]
MKKAMTVPTPAAPAARAIAVRIHAADMVTHAGLSHCLEQHPELTEASHDAAEEADVFVVAVENADASMLKLLKSLSPHSAARFMLVLDKQWDADVSTAVEHGVRAVLLRMNLSPATFGRAIVAVMQGEGIFPPKLQGALMQQVQQVQRDVLAPQGLTSSGFSEREIDVFRLLSEGLDLEEVAQKLCYSERTVKNILYNAMKRHKLRNRTHAVSHAIRSGLI